MTTRPHPTSVVTHHLWSDTFLIDRVRLLFCIPINMLTSAARRSEECTTGVSKQSRWKKMPCTLAHGDVNCPGADFISLCILPEPPREPRGTTERAVAMRLFLAVIRRPVADPTGGIPRLRSVAPAGDEIASFRTVKVSLHWQNSSDNFSVCICARVGIEPTVSKWPTKC